MSAGTRATRESRWLPWHAVAVFAFLYLPIVTLIVYSFNGQGVGGFPPRNLTLDWYRMLFADDAIWTSVLNSLLVALVAVAIALAFGIPAALALDRANFPGKAVFRRLVLLPLILPGIITGLSLLMLFREANLKLSLVTIMLGHGTALASVVVEQQSEKHSVLSLQHPVTGWQEAGMPLHTKPAAQAQSAHVEQFSPASQLPLPQWFGVGVLVGTLVGVAVAGVAGGA